MSEHGNIVRVVIDDLMGRFQRDMDAQAKSIAESVRSACWNLCVDEYDNCSCRTESIRCAGCVAVARVAERIMAIDLEGK